MARALVSGGKLAEELVHLFPPFLAMGLQVVVKLSGPLEGQPVHVPSATCIGSVNVPNTRQVPSNTEGAGLKQQISAVLLL